VEKASNQNVYSLETYIKALDTILENAVQEGIIGIKWHVMPYLRDMDYDIANTYDAANCFDRILQMPARGGAGSSTAVGFDEMRPFQDLIQNHLIQRAIELELPIQIHAATLGGSYGGPLQNGRPVTLMKLFLRYPQARFNILHAGYPYSRELGSVAHIFGNVYINAAWLDILSPEAYKHFMKDWILAIPLNKFFAFGADEFGIFLTCAGIEMVKDLLAEVFTELVAGGRISEEDIPFMADCILRRNLSEFWNLENRRIPGL